MELKAYRQTMSTTLTNGQSEIDTTEKLDHYTLEVEHAMARAQQRARAFVSQTAPQSAVTSPTDSPEANKVWQPISRDTSSEQFKSSLKMRPRLPRANSEPSQKSVHFSTTNLVDVRQYKRSQSPSAVGKKPRFYTESRDDSDDSSNSSDEDYDDDTDTEDEDYSNSYGYMVNRSRHRKRVHDESKGWTLLTPGFVPRSKSRLSGPDRPDCYIETLQLGSSPFSLKAEVYVRNLGFEKYVALRYSIDNWTSFGETKGAYSNDIKKFDRDAGFDRFDVSIPLNSIPSDKLNGTSMKFCVHYIVNSKEFWDNNGGPNYEIFLRNSKLAKRESRRQDETSETTDSNIKSNNDHAFNHERSRSASEPDLAHSMAGMCVSDTDDSEGCPSPDFTRGTDIRLRKRDEMKHRDPFVDRYSFESALASTPRAPSRPRSPVFIISGDQIIGQPKPIPDEYRASARSPGLGVTSNAEQKESDTHILDSESYKEFVSKYCFYTPYAENTALSVKPKAKQQRHFGST